MMNNKGLYTSAIGILIILLIAANIFVFLGSEKSNLGSSANGDILKVKKASARAELILDGAFEHSLYEGIGPSPACINNSTNTTIRLDLQDAVEELNDTYAGGITCTVDTYNPTPTADTITLRCNGGSVTYYQKDIEIDKRLENLIPGTPCTFGIKDYHANNTNVYAK
ncbi:MAG: hypothetical protein V1672_02100 [Candidatus Diapherotrites archaeon]